MMMMAGSAGLAVWNILAAAYLTGPMPTWANSIYLGAIGVSISSWLVLARRTLHRGWWPGWPMKSVLGVPPLLLGLCAFLPTSWWEAVFWTTEPWRSETYGLGYQIHCAWMVMLIAVGAGSLIRRAEHTRGVDQFLAMGSVFAVALGVGGQLADYRIMSTTGTVTFLLLVATHLRMNPNSVAALAQMADRDAVTGAMSRGGLDLVLRHAVRTAEARETPLCLMVIDVDNFKEINDSYGHITGDGALRHITERIREVVGDTVGRFGGDEFVVVLSDVTLSEAHALARRMVGYVARPFHASADAVVQVSISVGVAQYGEGSVADLLITADRAMYAAKRSGGGVAGLAHPA